MRYFLIALLFVACDNSKELKFRKGDLVMFKPPAFYSKVCYGLGKVDAYETHAWFETTYLVVTNAGCPNLWIKESDLALDEVTNENRR